MVSSPEEDLGVWDAWLSGFSYQDRAAAARISSIFTIFWFLVPPNRARDR
jgi:hypothetical protein